MAPAVSASFRDLNHEACDKAVDVGVGNRRRREHRKQGADWHNVALLRDQAAKGSRSRTFKHIGDLRRLDFGDLLPLFDLRPILDKPRREHALFHGEAPFRHDDRLNVAHQVRPFVTARTASRIFAAVGT